MVHILKTINDFLLGYIYLAIFLSIYAEIHSNPGTYFLSDTTEGVCECV